MGGSSQGRAVSSVDGCTNKSSRLMDEGIQTGEVTNRVGREVQGVGEARWSSAYTNGLDNV